MSKISKIAFQIKNLNLWYNNGSKQALFNISVDLPKGKTTALIGPSGCGKSTFLRTLNKMNDLIDGVKIDGSILFDEQTEVIGKTKSTKEQKKRFKDSRKKIILKYKKKLENLSKDSDYKKNKESLKLELHKNISKERNNILQVSPMELRTRVGMVFQKPNPFAMSIFDNVAYGPRSSGVTNIKQLNTIVKESLVDAALWDEVKENMQDSAFGLSGGQQQRLCIARTIAMKPEVLLMDEPTSSLDPIATGKIEKLIEKLKKKFTIIIVTHSMQQAARVSDKTAFFYMGELIEFNNTRTIFTRPKNQKTSDYITGKMG